MKGFWRRLRPDHLTGQITLLVLAAIILYHLALTTLHYVGAETRRPHAEPDELLAGALLAIDAAEVADRAEVLAALVKVAPWAKFTLLDRPPDMTESAGGEADITALSAWLWDGARVFVMRSNADKGARQIGAALRKGGYIVALAPHALRIGAGAPPPMRIIERSALFFFLCASILTIWLSGAVVAPLVRLAREAERFPDECATRRPIAEAGPQEVRDLTRALNRMQHRIEAMIETRSRALAAISHDLRTIITRMSLRCEFIADEELRAKMRHDAELMDSMLGKNLQHLREARQAPHVCPIDLDSVLQTVCDQFADLGHDVTYRGGRGHVILGSLTEMQRVFNNLVENAVTHAKQVVITIDQPSAQLVRVDVADDGPGIPGDGKTRVLEPFVRGEPARTMNDHCGFGLGLSIVRSLVQEAGGGFQLLDREPRGLIARVTLPRAFAGE